MSAAVRITREPAWHTAVDVDRVLRAQGAEPGAIRHRSPRLLAVAERALRIGVPLVEPAVLVRRCRVVTIGHATVRLEGGGVLTGDLPASQLAPAREVVVLAVTAGPALDAAAHAALARDPALALALDGLGTTAVEALAAGEVRRITDGAAEQGWCAGSPLSPGMEGWPVERGQEEIFALLKGADDRIRLSPEGMMRPRKSLSLVLGLGPLMLAGASTCDFCGVRARCRYRSGE